jgi:hypothetical protein
MSYERNIQWLNDRRVNYRQEPINDEPTFSNDHYSYYEDGTHEYYRLFYTPSKITTYKSLKWHLLVLKGGDAPKNKARKIIFKDYNGLSFNEKMKVVGQLSGRQKLDKEKIYDTMLYLNDFGKPITNGRLAGLLNCSIRTIQRHMCADLKREKQRLNEEIQYS